MSKSTTVNEYGFAPFAINGLANGECQSLLQSTKIHCYFCWINMYGSINAFLKLFVSTNTDQNKIMDHHILLFCI